jgi:excisionase family DNA binding protein
MADPIAAGWITTSEAASLTGYDRAYVRRLARQGRVAACKVAQEWLIEEDSLLAYKQQMDELGVQRFNPRRQRTVAPGAETAGA